jgi:hypothetical protein
LSLETNSIFLSAAPSIALFLRFASAKKVMTASSILEVNGVAGFSAEIAKGNVRVAEGIL